MYENFNRLLKKKKMTAYAVSKRTGLSPTVFSDWKSGKSKPKVDKLIKIANCLGVSLEELIDRNANSGTGGEK